MDKLGPVALEHHAIILYSRISRYNDLPLRKVNTLNLATGALCTCMLAGGPQGSEFHSRILIRIAQGASFHSRILITSPQGSDVRLRILIRIVQRNSFHSRILIRIAQEASLARVLGGSAPRAPPWLEFCKVQPHGSDFPLRILI